MPGKSIRSLAGAWMGAVALAGMLAMALSLAMVAVPHAENEVITQAQRLMDSGDYDAAINILAAHTNKNPEDGLAWATLANAWHSKGDYEKSVEMNRRAAQFPGVRPSARYNEACALSLLGRVDEAHSALETALEDGFLDFDLLAADPDLQALRAKHTIDFPKVHEYQAFEAPNGIELGYKVLLPSDFDAAKTYPGLILFPPGNGSRTADWALSELLGDDDDTRGWIVVYPVGPERGWFTHPSHHALNGLLDMLKTRYHIEGGKFHLAGFEAGARTATTYSQMSREHFQSLTVFSGWHWRSFDNDQLGAAFDGIPIRLVVGAKDEFGAPLNQRISERMSAQGVDVQLTVVEKDDQLLASIRHGKIIEYISCSEGMMRSAD
ncbi:MAG: hypothetical protein IH969_07265 [Candidatus Krumholzibacteriota bacterium]|nr:hypothetical protein [Candidatus Krumholzibacteriota bacterium]